MKPPKRFAVRKTNKWGQEQERFVEVVGGLVLRNTDGLGRVKREVPLAQLCGVERSLGEPRRLHRKEALVLVIKTKELCL